MNFLSPIPPIGKRQSTLSTAVHVLGLLFVLLATGCSSTIDSPPDPTVYAFSRGAATVQLVRVGIDSAILITQANPTIQGKGRLTLEATGSELEDTIFVVRPVLDTLASYYNYASRTGRINVTLPWEFQPGQVAEQIWLVRLKPYDLDEYSFGTRATMDSVFVPDSNRYYGAYSEEVSDYLRLGPNRRFQHIGVSTLPFP